MPALLHFACNARWLTANGVTVYIHGDTSLCDSLTATLRPESKIKPNCRTISRVEKVPNKAEMIAHLGSRKVEAFTAHKPKPQLTGNFGLQLSLELTPRGDTKTTPPFYQTSAHGVFTGGDTKYPVQIVPNASLTGAAAAAGVSAQVQAVIPGHNSMV